MYDLYSILTAVVPTSIWQFLVLAFVLTNLKCLPLIWHFRLARSFYVHFPFNQYSPQQSSYIFQPVITSSRSPLLDCDYNLHKSNSSYFTDLDISRGHLLTCLLGNGINKTRLARGQEGGNKKGRFGFYLGGVTCHFRRELRPFEAFEIWTRVLCWDDKWLYLVSHIVKYGSATPMDYSLQPWKNVKEGPSNLSKDRTDKPRPTIYACSIAKYVFKRGRLTIPPETVLEHTALLPARPKDQERLSSTSSALGDHFFSQKGLRSNTQKENRPDSEAILEATMDENVHSNSWDWERVEAERSRGMEVAASMAALDRLDQEFTGETQSALGHF